MYQLPSHPQACKLVFHPPSIPSGSNYPGTSVNVSHWYASHSSPYMRPLWPLPREVWRFCSHHHCTWWKTFVVLYIAIYAIPKVQSNAPKKTWRLFVWTVRSTIGKPALNPHSNNTTPQHSVMTKFAPRLGFALLPQAPPHWPENTC